MANVLTFFLLQDGFQRLAVSSQLSAVSFQQSAVSSQLSATNYQR